MNTTAERLARLRNRATCYEIAAIQGERRILIAYAAMHSRHGLLKACQNRGQMIIAALGIGESDLLMPAKRAAEGFTVGAWSIRFTGRTERDAIQEGELPYVGDLAKQAA